MFGLVWFPDIEIGLERLVPLQSGIIPVFWVEGDECNTIEATLRSDPLTQDVRLLSKVNGRSLFEIEWSSDVNHLVQPLVAADAEVLGAEGTVDAWKFRLQFMTQQALITFLAVYARASPCMEFDYAGYHIKTTLARRVTVQPT